MSYTDKLLEDIRDQIKPSDETLEAARARRDDVLAGLKDFDGRLRAYAAGSIGHRTANDDTDADCGLVLDRRVYQDLGPDGDSVGPEDIVQRVRSTAHDNLKEKYPDITTSLTKRAIVFGFHLPVGSGDDARDPSVDLIVALTRKDADGLWIPNRETNGWDASHPEHHTKLLTDPPDELRRLRARTVRLVKGWDAQYSERALVPFNIEALALETITETMSIGAAVTRWFEYAARELRKANTKDPAGVSPAIKLLLERNAVVSRLESVAKHMREALDHDDDEDAVTEQLAVVFYKYVQKPGSDSSKAALASSLRGGNTSLNRAGAYVTAGAAAGHLKTVRSHGDGKVR
jgi:hypothetical protein